MQYMGGKARQAKPIGEILSVYRATCREYVEPFIGGGAVFERAARTFRRPAGYDVHPDLVLMWQAALDGWTPPAAVTREEYAELRNAEPSALRGFVGFGCSFGGKWFGGYASNARGDDFCGAARRGLLRKADALRQSGATVGRQSYDVLDPAPGALVYCDPPYAGTTGYDGVDTFDHAAFWARVHEWADAGATVLVSEYEAPEGVPCVWRREAVKSLRKDANTLPATEKLFAVGGKLTNHLAVRAASAA